MRNYANTFSKFINERYSIFENENNVFTQVTSELGSFKNAEISRDSIAWKHETPSGEYWDLALFMDDDYLSFVTTDETSSKIFQQVTGKLPRYNQQYCRWTSQDTKIDQSNPKATIELIKKLVNSLQS